MVTTDRSSFALQMKRERERQGGGDQEVEDGGVNTGMNAVNRDD